MRSFAAKAFSWPGCVNFAQQPTFFLFFEGVIERD
jgi:hypothetical protein